MTGIVYWTAATLLASAMPIKLPRGTVVSVASAPILAAMILGGPLAAAIVSFVGTTDEREIRGQVPWYGTLYNHSSAIISVGVAGIFFDLLSGTPLGDEPIALFVLALVASAIFLSLNWFLAVLAVSIRTDASIRLVWAQDVSGVAANLIGLAPLAWLMALVFQLPNGIGWWATPLFVVPLFTTRLAYARYVETRLLFEQTIQALSKAVDARDNYTRNHSSRVSHISEAMARVMRLPEPEIEKITWAALLHDIGKIGIRDNVLLKEGPLDKAERILMNQHPEIGAEIVRPATQLAGEAPLILAHHEWFNGSGYPGGVEALDIPLGARIMTIADAYEAMTSSRPYRKIPLTHEQAVDQLEKFAGIQFDPDIVPILVNLDRSILDRPPDRPDELPTMRHQPDPRDHDDPPEDERIVAAKPPPAADGPPSRPALASDDVP
ncbi:MAG: HD-GYP domain-containing protein [Chloroflexi bacterium]|nr:HD-GYP domain-containing protein [Chloroflexota bacterium]